MAFTIIAALDEERGIGRKGTLPWRLKADLAHFKRETVGDLEGSATNAVMMGRTTWESLPHRPLSDRLNIVLTSRPLVVPPEVVVVGSLDEALAVADERHAPQTFVIGGSKVFAEAIQHPDCVRLSLTHLRGTFDCDAFFPPIPESFAITSRSRSETEGAIAYEFVEYLRIEP